MYKIKDFHTTFFLRLVPISGAQVSLSHSIFKKYLLLIIWILLILASSALYFIIVLMSWGSFVFMDP